MPSSGPQRLRVDAEVSRSRAASAIAHGACTRPPNGVSTHAPVPDLVAEALDHDGAVGGDDARRALLVAQERDEVRGRPALEVVVVLQAVARGVVGERDELARGAADPLTQLERAADTLALPEGCDPQQAGSQGRHEDAVARIDSIRQVDAPRTNVRPSRASYTISSSSSPTRPPPSSRNTPKSPRSGIVPAFVTASRRADPARTSPAVRSQTIRGRSSANSSDG